MVGPWAFSLPNPFFAKSVTLSLAGMYHVWVYMAIDSACELYLEGYDGRIVNGCVHNAEHNCKYNSFLDNIFLVSHHIYYMVFYVHRFYRNIILYVTLSVMLLPSRYQG